MSRLVQIALREAGVNLEALARRAGIDPGPWGAVDGPLPAPQIWKLLTLSAAEVDDPSFGLRSGARVRPELLGTVGLACMSAATLGAALECLARYRRVVGCDHWEIRKDRAITQIFMHQGDRELPHAHQQLDADLSSGVAFGRCLTGHRISPLRVAIRFPKPPYHPLYEELLGCAVEFDAHENEVTLRNEDLDLPLLSASGERHDLFAEKADELLSSTSGGLRIADRTRVVLRRWPRGELPTIGPVARILSLSERSLQRGLHQEGTSFQELLDEIRLDLTWHHLRNPRLDITEIAYLLGFANPSSFYRAFKRWTGTTPEEYRRLGG